MTAGPVSLELDSLPLEQMRRVNILADRFETELRAGARPSVALYLSELDESDAQFVILRLVMLTQHELERDGSPGTGQDVSSGAGSGAATSGVAGNGAPDAVLIAKCRHPNLVQIYHTGEHEGVPYLALEYAEGGSLEKRLDGTPWPPRRAAELMEPLARAVAVVYEQGDLLGQKKYRDAERELLAGYEGMKAREASIPLEAREGLRRTAAWLVEVYEALGMKEKADEWRKR
jgi:hypothetical protein